MEDKKRKILVVDDEQEIVNMLKEFLSLKGYTVKSALSGEEALSILEKEQTDLILLDIMMPGLKGTEVAKIIKDKYPSIKLIILTGFPRETEALSKDNLLEGIFVKPVRLIELYNKLSELLTPAEDSVLDKTTKVGIRARVMLIKAKLLFIEPSLEVYNFLSKYFLELSNQGENYELDVASNEENIIEKASSFKPDLLLINASLFKDYNTKILPKVSEKNFSPKEIIIYNKEDVSKLQKTELDKVVKSVETACLKNGLLEIKWIEI